jgi:DNA-binding response OmpR family regulator
MARILKTSSKNGSAMTQMQRKISERPLLIVGPDPKRLAALSVAMRVCDFDVVEAVSNARATRLIDERTPSGVICAWPLKGVNGGVELVKHLRSHDERILIVVIGLTVVASNVRETLQAGADLCLPASFNLDSLAVHMDVGIRRRLTALLPKKVPIRNQIHVGDLTLDIPAHQVRRGEVEVPLTRTGFRLLITLVRHAGNVVSKAVLFEECWRRHDDPRGEDDHLVEVHVAKLRKKLHAAGPPILQTVYGVGYSLRPQSP